MFICYLFGRRVRELCVGRSQAWVGAKIARRFRRNTPRHESYENPRYGSLPRLIKATGVEMMRG
jgi:hypothetical protein